MCTSKMCAGKSQLMKSVLNVDLCHLSLSSLHVEETGADVQDFALLGRVPGEDNQTEHNQTNHGKCQSVLLLEYPSRLCMLPGQSHKYRYGYK